MNLSLHRLFFIAIAMMAVGMFSSSANAQGARLLYNPSDGNVQIEINEMLIQTFQIETRDTNGITRPSISNRRQRRP